VDDPERRTGVANPKLLAGFFQRRPYPAQRASPIVNQSGCRERHDSAADQSRLSGQQESYRDWRQTVADSGQVERVAVQPAGGFSIVRVLVLVGAIGLVTGGGYYVWNQTQGERPKVPFTGIVLFEGRPVTTGSVMTEVIGDPLDFSMGYLDQQGRFSLETNGETGASVGRHKVRISSLAPGIPPRPLVPPKYLETATSPLEIEVTSDPARNDVVFELEGTIPAPAAAGGPPAGPPGGAPTQPSGTEPAAGAAAPAATEADSAAENAEKPAESTEAAPN
jgi:hypothetical protein